MASQTLLAPHPRRIFYSISSSPSPSEGIIDTGGYKSQFAHEIAVGQLAQTNIASIDVPEDNLNWHQWARHWDQTHPIPDPPLTDEAPPSTDPALLNVDSSTPRSRPPFAQPIDTHSLPSGYYNSSTSTLTSGPLETALRNIFGLSNLVSASLNPTCITGVTTFPRLQIAPPLSRLFNFPLEVFTASLFDSPMLEALDQIEVEHRLQDLEENGQPHIAARLMALQDTDEEDEDDVPIDGQAILGFLDFMDQVAAEGIDPDLTTAQGWLCAQWTYPDNRILVLWFKNRVDLMVTAFGPNGRILRHIGRDPRSRDKDTASQFLLQEGFFSWPPNKTA